MFNDKTTECLLCGNTATLKQSNYPGYLQPDVFSIYYCSSCDTAFSLPRGNNDKVYDSIYRNGEIMPGYDRYWEYSRSVKNFSNPIEYLSSVEETYWGVKEALNLLVVDKKSVTLLEIGSGLGYFTYSLNRDNYNVIGLDISQTAVKQAIIEFGNYYVCGDLFDFSQNHLAEFNIIILTEVIEHIDQPKEFVKAIYRLLKKGGSMIITTPNKTLYPKDLLWATELPPVHCWWFSEESMRYIAQSIGCKISFINFKSFYKKNYHPVDANKIYPGPNPRPVLDVNGDLLISPVRKKMQQISVFRSLMSRIPYVKNAVRTLRKLFYPKIIICKDRGIVLCAVIEK